MSRSIRKRLGVVCAAAALGLAGVGRCLADDVSIAPRFDPWKYPRQMRQAVAERWEKVRLVPESFRHAGVERASYTASTGGEGRKIVPDKAEAATSVPTAKAISWWLVPRRARSAAQKYAKAQNKTVTRVVRVAEPDGTARFEVYAASRIGRKWTPETVLVSVDDAKGKAKVPDDVPLPGPTR